MTTTTVHTGRPLDTELSETILVAAFRVLTRDGYSGFNMAAVAQEAGVHRPAIYRRWSSKTDLAVAAIEQFKPAPIDRNTGDVRADLVAYLVDTALGTGEQYAIAFGLASDLATHKDLSDAVQVQIVQPRRATLTAMLRRGIDSGQLRTDLDTDTAIDLVTGVLHPKAGSAPLTRAAIERYVDMALRGLQAP
jgi:AcrR family transcriptional regulator